jgi:hypothetical protein
MLTRRSPPQPATNRTPSGGTTCLMSAVSFRMLKEDVRMTVMITIQINSSRPIVLDSSFLSEVLSSLLLRG